MNPFCFAGILITVIISAERCSVVMKKANVTTKEFADVKKTKRTLIVVYICSFVFHLPFLFYYDLSANGLDLSTYASSLFFEVYAWVRLLGVKLMPIVLVVIFNIIIVKVTWSNNNRPGIAIFQTTVQRQRSLNQHRMTKMLLCITILFVITNCLEPFMHPNIYAVIFGKCSEYSHQRNILVLIVNTAEAISFASNFVIFCVFNPHFVVALKQVTKWKTSDARVYSLSVVEHKKKSVSVTTTSVLPITVR